MVRGDLQGSGVDWLTVTVGRTAAEGLLSWSAPCELAEGKATAGFGVTEQRKTMGGTCWRRWDPHQASKEWGTDYETWEWVSAAAQWPAAHLRGLDDVRPSRVDVAFDFSVGERVRPGGVVKPCVQHIGERGMTTGGSGQGGIWTRYVGAINSERRIRIYRKDAREGDIFLQTYGPVLRVELVLKDAKARAWWAVWRECQNRGIHAAAAHILEMTGRSVLATAEPVPPALVEPDPEADAAQMVLQFVEQHASALGRIQDLGVDLFALAARVRKTWPRGTRLRDEQRRLRESGADGELVEAAVIRALASRTKRALHNM